MHTWTQVDLVKSFPTTIYLQRFVSTQPRTSLSKFAKNWQKVRKKVRTFIGSNGWMIGGVDLGMVEAHAPKWRTLLEEAWLADMEKRVGEDTVAADVHLVELDGSFTVLSGFTRKKNLEALSCVASCVPLRQTQLTSAQVRL